jgi:hypothetical protein
MDTQKTQSSDTGYSHLVFNSTLEADAGICDHVDCEKWYHAVRTLVVHKNAGKGVDFNRKYVASNVPVYSTQKSEEYEFGYAGSGPTSFACNLMADALMFIREAILDKFGGKAPSAPEKGLVSLERFFFKKLVVDLDNSHLSPFQYCFSAFPESSIQLRDSNVFECQDKDVAISNSDDCDMISIRKQDLYIFIGVLIYKYLKNHSGKPMDSGCTSNFFIMIHEFCEKKGLT